jgi:2-keto-4-pentenoate hydratase/2-oxohepta-3-ene-1,7-dioic acid hydratase in catechol pathway
MKLLRYGPANREKPGLLDADGKIRDLSGYISDIEGEVLSPKSLTRLSAVGKFIAVGLNYADHAAEANMAIPKEPIIFTKATSCIIGPNDDVVLPPNSTKSDWEVELGIVIGSTARYIEERDAFDHVAGYCIVNDVSEREYQLERGGSWDKGKGFDTYGPVGPILSRPMRLATRRRSACGSRSMATKCRRDQR